MQYSAAALRLKAVEDVLAGPSDLHASLHVRLDEVRALRADHVDAQVRPDAEDFAALRPGRPRRRELAAERPASRIATVRAAASGILHQTRAVGAGSVHGPEREVAAVDAGWWTLAGLDSALVATADGAGLAWLRRDRSVAAAGLTDAVRAHRELLRRWRQLSAEYRDAAPSLAGEDSWRRTLGLDAGSRSS